MQNDNPLHAPETLVIPLFDLVYHDCIAMYGKYGYDPKQAAAYVLAHISLTRPLNYHAIPPHLYWQASASEAPKAAPWMGPDPALFTRADNGWAAGLHPLDRFIKNTYEVLSPLNELTARQRLMQHQFLTPDRKVERTVFGTGTNEVRVVVNASATNYVCASTTGQPVLLPPFGFLAESREFVAFCALSWGGVKYAAPALFTLRSLDGKGLAQAQRVRIFHGFGSDAIASPQGEQHVPREVVLTRP